MTLYQFEDFCNLGDDRYMMRLTYNELCMLCKACEMFYIGDPDVEKVHFLWEDLKKFKECIEK